ncbi:MAG: co-chaperone GroES [Pseudomonadales bacterium]
MKLKPLHDRVLIRPVEEDDRSPGGIVIPDKAKEKPQRGEVLATGPGEAVNDGKVRALAVKAGDRVLYGKYGGSEVTIDGEKLVVLKESDILAIVNDK